MYKVSIIIPVYNVETTLDRCIQSVLNQSLQDIEIILVDDGSPDKCPQLCDRYAKENTGIKVIHKQNEGLGFARNTGIEVAEGEYIGFVDSDDYIETNMYERLYTYAKDNECDIAYGGYRYIVNGDTKAIVEMTTSDRIITTNKGIRELLLDQIASEVTIHNDSKYGATVWKGLFLRKLVVENNIRFYSEREYVSEDGLFDIDVFAKCSKIALISGSYYNYEYNPNSLTAVYRKGRFEQNKRLYNLGCQKLYNNYKDDKMIIQYGRMFIAASRVCIMQEIYHYKEMGIKECFHNLHIINRDDVLQSVIASYPWRRLPLSKKIMCFLMKNDMAILEFLLVKMHG